MYVLKGHYYFQNFGIKMVISLDTQSIEYDKNLYNTIDLIHKMNLFYICDLWIYKVSSQPHIKYKDDLFYL